MTMRIRYYAGSEHQDAAGHVPVYDAARGRCLDLQAKLICDT
jgi:hypothetical protein